MSNPGLQNPEDISIAIKCLPTKWAKKMIEEGSLHFKCAEALSHINSKGKGDKYEGSFTNIDINNYKLFNFWKNVYGDNLELLTNKDLIYLKNRNACLLPAYCFYTLKNKNLKISKVEAGLQKATGEISEILFRDFADGRSIDQIEELPVEERPAIVFILRPDIFKNKIIEEFKKMGVTKTRIITKHVKYMNFNKKFLITNESPEELFYKDNYYSYQDETRIVVNSENLRFEKYSDSIDINIGDMSSYAQLNMDYYYDGLTFDCNVILENLNNNMSS